MPKDLIWQNQALGTRTYYHFDESDQSISLETIQDIDPIIEENKRIANDHSSHPRWGEGKLAARIPLIVMQQLVEQGILSPQWAIADERRFRAWLNSPDNRHFRTFPGTL
jgi:hypothetical protein